MAIRVITVAREFGSGGGSIARLLAARLAWRLLDRELLVEVAKAAHVDPKVCEPFDERCDPWFSGLVRTVWHGTGGTGDEDLLDTHLLADLSRKVIVEAARQGECVVVGRGGQCVLRGKRDVFHMFVYAPFELRKRRVAERSAPLGAPLPDLEEFVRENDRARAEYIQKYFGQNWCNPHLYDMMINSRWGDEQALAAVLAAAGLAASYEATISR